VPDHAVLLDAIARRVRSGSSLTSAVIDEIDRDTTLGVVTEQLASGSSLITALSQVVPRHADLALTVQALSATAHLGGPVAATLDEAAAVLRERSSARAERRPRIAGSAQRAGADRRSAGVRGVECSGQPADSRHLPLLDRRWHLCIARLGVERDRLAVDEQDHRAMSTTTTVPVVFAGGGSAALVLMLACWRRPRPVTRCARTRTHRRSTWFVFAAMATWFSPVLGLAALAAPPIWWRWSGMRRRARAARTIAHEFPDALDLLVLSIRAGYLPAQAIVEVVAFLPHPLRPAFAR
jgi:Flp pilus assembly protein TadB